MRIHSSLRQRGKIAVPSEKSLFLRILRLGLLTPAFLLAMPGLAQQASSGPYADASTSSNSPVADRSGGSGQGPNANGPGARDARIEPLNETGGCGDPLSAALHQDGDQSPCWADVRAVDHWNTMSLANGPTVQNGPGFLPAALESRAAFTFALGGLGGLLFANNANSSAYAGAGAFSGYVERPRWQLMYEDGGGLGNFMLNGSHLAGLNRAAIRANGELTARWLWQGSATNAYGNDTLRLFAPLDYRTVGATEAPVSETVAYGLHAGNLVDEQEDFKVSTSESRRSNWNFAARIPCATTPTTGSMFKLCAAERPISLRHLTEHGPGRDSRRRLSEWSIGMHAWRRGIAGADEMGAERFAQHQRQREWSIQFLRKSRTVHRRRVALHSRREPG
jgi:hypothetical protein